MCADKISLETSVAFDCLLVINLSHFVLIMNINKLPNFQVSIVFPT